MTQTGEMLLFSSGSEDLPILAALGTVAGLYFFYRGFLLLRRKRLIVNTPSSKIRSASMGLVEISGLAIGPHVIRSPLKQTDCFCYHSIAWEWTQRGKNKDWVKVAEESLHIPFYVNDNSGTLLIDPRGAEMDLHCELREEYNDLAVFKGQDMPAPVYSFLARHGADSSKRIKVEEYCIGPKNFLFVLGTLSQNPGLDTSIMPPGAGHSSRPAAASASAAASAPLPNTSPNQSTGQQVVHLSEKPAPLPVTEMTQQQKIAAALVKAGITSPMAWAAAGVTTDNFAEVKPNLASDSPAKNVIRDQETPQQSGTDEVFDLHPPVVLMKGTNEQTFFISWRSQREVIESLGWKSTLMIWGGPGLTLVCVYFLLAHFNWL